MNNFANIAGYLVVMAGVTYLIRAVPFVVFRKRIKNRFIQSFLYYIPYAVLAAMTFPSIFYSTGSVSSAVVGVVAGIIMAFLEKSLLTVAVVACSGVLLGELAIKFLF